MGKHGGLESLVTGNEIEHGESVQGCQKQTLIALCTRNVRRV